MIKYSLILLGSGLLANAILATVMTNFSTGILLTYLLGGILVTSGLIGHHLPTWLLLAVGGGLLMLAVCATMLFLYGKRDTVTYKEDVVIVLGASVKGDKPTKSLQNRLDRAIAYHQQNPHARIVVSGGKGDGETVSEAAAMARYLMDCGIPDGAIIQEDAATSTEENFRFSRTLLASADSVCFITTDYHILRASRYAERAGFQHITHAHSATPWYMIVPSCLRECLALGKWLLSTL